MSQLPTPAEYPIDVPVLSSQQLDQQASLCQARRLDINNVLYAASQLAASRCNGLLGECEADFHWILANNGGDFQSLWAQCSIDAQVDFDAALGQLRGKYDLLQDLRAMYQSGWRPTDEQLQTEYGWRLNQVQMPPLSRIHQSSAAASPTIEPPLPAPTQADQAATTQELPQSTSTTENYSQVEVTNPSLTGDGNVLLTDDTLVKWWMTGLPACGSWSSPVYTEQTVRYGDRNQRTLDGIPTASPVGDSYSGYLWLFGNGPTATVSGLPLAREMQTADYRDHGYVFYPLEFGNNPLVKPYRVFRLGPNRECLATQTQSAQQPVPNANPVSPVPPAVPPPAAASPMPPQPPTSFPTQQTVCPAPIVNVSCASSCPASGQSTQPVFVPTGSGSSDEQKSFGKEPGVNWLIDANLSDLTRNEQERFLQAVGTTIADKLTPEAVMNYYRSMPTLQAPTLEELDRKVGVANV